MNKFMSIAEAKALILSGESLSLAGPESVLDQMPPGNWIGGTSSYFMLDTGGTVVTDDHVFVTRLDRMGNVRIAYYRPEDLRNIVGNTGENGMAVTIIPAGSVAHQRFADEAADYPGAFLKPTVGWISGVHLSEIGRVTPKIYDGRKAEKHEDGVVVAHIAIPSDKLPFVEIVNPFEAEEGDVIRFYDNSFKVGECEVNGERVSFAEYVRGRGLESGTRPLVGDFAGARLNVSLQSVQDGIVTLYAPVIPGVDYRFAKPVTDYAEEFRSRLEGMESGGAAISCNCILNFELGGLKGKAIGGVQGPVTFGEIAYQLLNQTLVIARVD